MRMLDVVSIILLIFGGIVLGLVGIFDFNLIEFFFKPGGEEFHVHRHLSVMTRIIYILIGASAVYQIFQRKAIFNVRK